MDIVSELLVGNHYLCHMEQKKRKPYWDVALSLVPIVSLVAMLSVVIRLFGADALSGGSQVALLCASAVSVLVGVFCFKVKWAHIESVVIDHVSKVGSALFILMLIGALSGVWILSGVVPLMIHYGLQIMNPHTFLFSACMICAIVSVMTGSSWTTIATIGVALLGIGKAQGFSEGLVAGAIISGAYFGDKISPLSDTTVLAASITDTPLFSHIRYMMFTTVPSMLIALTLFALIGMTSDTADTSRIDVYSSALHAKFHLSPWLLIVPAVTFVMILRRMPALVVLFLSTILATVCAIVFQPHVLAEVAGTTSEDVSSLTVGALRGIYDTTSIDTGQEEVNALVATRGMRGMLDTIWLILCTMLFGGCMAASGMLRHITQLFLPLIRKTVGIVASTVCTGVFFNTVVADQYLSIILSGSIFKDLYRREGFESRLLSRSIEDSATITSPLIPWNSCGMTQSTILSVSTLTYLPYCFFNLISPLMSIIVASIGWKIARKGKGGKE